jgi:hypothetical protein
MFFSVRFTYPDDEAAAAKALADQRRREDAERRMQSMLDSPAVPKTTTTSVAARGICGRPKFLTMGVSPTCVFLPRKKFPPSLS